jgi:hypothetical protein
MRLSIFLHISWECSEDGEVRQDDVDGESTTAGGSDSIRTWNHSPLYVQQSPMQSLVI